MSKDYSGKGASYGVQIIKMVDNDRKSTKNILEDSKTRLLIWIRSEDSAIMPSAKI